MASKEIAGFGQSLGTLGGAVSTFAKVGLAAVATAGVALVGGLGASINQAMNFEAAMSAVAAVAGASDSELQQLSDTALQLGQDTTLSGIGATDAARAMRELAAAGMSATDIIGGGALGALRLASAGGIDVARAAEIAAMALSQFGLAGTDAAMVADLFASAANSSAISVDDIAETMKYVGPVASAMGLSIEEVTATVAALGNQGIKSSAAGTALRGMIVNLAKPSKEATKVMTDLGLSFFDGSGKMKDLAGISEELKTKLGGLTDKQRASALATLFGNEGMTAATILYGEGAAGINKWLGELENGATAAEVGAKRNDNLKGSIEALKSSFETAQIVLGKAFLPALKGIVDQMAIGVSAAIPLIEAWGPKLVAGISSAIGVIVAFGGYVASAIGAVVGAFRSLLSGQTTFAQFIGGMQTFVGTILASLGGLAAQAAPHIAAFFAAIMSFLAGALPQISAQMVIWAGALTGWLATAIPTLIGKLGEWGSAFIGWLTGTWIPLLISFYGPMAQAFGGWITGTAIPYLTTNLPLWKDAIVNWVGGTAIPAIAGAVGAVGAAFGGWIQGTAIPYLTTNLPLWKDAIVTWVTGTAIPEITTAVGAIASAFGGWISGTAIPYLTTNLPLWKDAIVTFITADVIPTVTGWVVGIGNALGSWITSAILYLQTNLPLWKDAIIAFITTDAIPTVTGAVVGLGNAIVGWVEGTAIPVVTEKLVAWSAAVTGGIATAAGVIQETSDSTLPPALNSGIDKAAGENRTHMETWNESIVSFLTGLPAQLDALLVPAAYSLGKWIGESLPTVIGKMEEWSLAIQAVIINLPAVIGALTVALVEPMWHWIEDSVEPAVTAFANYTANLLLAVADLQTSLENALAGAAASLIKAGIAIGVGIVDGIIEGILGGRGRVLGAAKSLGGAATEGAANELQEKSPSKVFRRIGLFAAEGLALGLEDGQADAAKKAADVASAVAKAVTDVLGASKALAGTNPNGGPSGAQFGWLTATTTALVQSMQDAAASFKAEGLKAAGEFADAASKVGGSVKNTLEGLAALAGFDFAKSSPTASALGWFTHLATSLVANFAIAAQQFGEGLLKDASDLADAAGKVGGSIKNTLEGLQLLAAADWAKSSPTGSAMGWFTHLAASLVANFATAGATFADGALKAANDFADSASKVGGSVKGALEGLQALASADWAKSSPSASAMGWFTSLVTTLVQSFATAAAQFETELLASTNRFAETAGKVAGVIGPALAGFKELATIVAPSQTSIDQLVAGIKYLVQRFSEMAATMEAEGVKAMGDFADATNKALGAAKTGTDLFKSFDKLVIPSAKAIDDLANGIRYVVQKFREMAGMLTSEGLTAMTAFATTAGQVLNAAKSGTDLFASMGKLAIPSKEAIDYLLGSMGYVITQTQAIANGIGTVGLQAAQAFATGTLNVFTTIKTTLENFSKLTEFKDIPTQTLDLLFKALESTMEKAGELTGRSDALKEEALQFLANMTAAAAAYQKGNGMAIGGPALAPAGVVASSAFSTAGGFDTSGSTTNVTLTGNIYGMSDFQDAVVAAVQTADRRGR